MFSAKTAIFLLAVTPCSGFAPARTRPSFGIARKTRLAYSSAAFSEDERPNAWLYEEEDPSAVNSNSAPPSGMELAAAITRDQLAQLAHIAVGFSPPEQHLELKNVNQVHVLNVNESQIEIEAVVCDQEQCVTLDVPVDFPEPCHEGEDMTQCILHNLEELDHEAEFKIHAYEQNAASEANDQLLFQQLTSLDGMSLPEWWMPVGGFMTEECDKMRQVLNRDDFQTEIRTIANQELASLVQHADFVIEKAAVVSICPTGMYLRASVKSLDGSSTQLVDLTFPFGKQVVSAEELQSAVLGAVSAASP